jgi:hypothetical protein
MVIWWHSDGFLIMEQRSPTGSHAQGEQGSPSEDGLTPALYIWGQHGGKELV